MANNNSRILTPFGKPVQRIQVDIDEKGQAQINGHKKGMSPLHVGATSTVPMSILEVTTVLAGVVASNLLVIAGAVPFQNAQQQRYRYPDATGHEFLAFEDNPDNCQLCGSHRRNHAAQSE